LGLGIFEPEALKDCRGSGSESGLTFNWEEQKEMDGWEVRVRAKEGYNLAIFKTSREFFFFLCLLPGVGHCGVVVDMEAQGGSRLGYKLLWVFAGEKKGRIMIRLALRLKAAGKRNRQTNIARERDAVPGSTSVYTLQPCFFLSYVSKFS
jgi:hypothetical protein